MPSFFLNFFVLNKSASWEFCNYIIKSADTLIQFLRVYLKTLKFDWLLYCLDYIKRGFGLRHENLSVKNPVWIPFKHD